MLHDSGIVAVVEAASAAAVVVVAIMGSVVAVRI